MTMEPFWPWRSSTTLTPSDSGVRTSYHRMYIQISHLSECVRAPQRPLSKSQITIAIALQWFRKIQRRRSVSSHRYVLFFFFFLTLLIFLNDYNNSTTPRYNHGHTTIFKASAPTSTASTSTYQNVFTTHFQHYHFDLRTNRAQDAWHLKPY